MSPQTLADLRSTHAQFGRVVWLGVRSDKGAPMVSRLGVTVGETGLEGDRYAGRSGKRAVTFLQSEHMPVIAALSGRERIVPEQLRRNILVAGINLGTLKDGAFQVGSAVFEITVACHPCSKMEKALGPGGYNAMRGHGGWCARVLEPGAIRLGDRVRPI